MAYKVTFTIQKSDTAVDTIKTEAVDIFFNYMADGRVLDGYENATEDPSIVKSTIIFLDETSSNEYFAEFETLSGGSGLNGHTILSTETEII